MIRPFPTLLNKHSQPGPLTCARTAGHPGDRTGVLETSWPRTWKLGCLSSMFFQEISNRTHWTDPSTWVSNSSSNLLRGPLVRSHSMFDGFLICFESFESYISHQKHHVTCVFVIVLNLCVVCIHINKMLFLLLQRLCLYVAHAPTPMTSPTRSKENGVE